MGTMTDDYQDIRYTADELEGMPTLEEGWTDDLKVRLDGGGVRVWLARTTTADGEPFDRKVTVEARDERGRWFNAVAYDGDNPDDRITGTYEEPAP